MRRQLPGLVLGVPASQEKAASCEGCPLPSHNMCLQPRHCLAVGRQFPSWDPWGARGDFLGSRLGEVDGGPSPHSLALPRAGG